MQGYSALWMPGTDHAGIATQIKVEENLRKEEGLTRYDLGREKFLERVWDWKTQVSATASSASSRSSARPVTGSASASRWTRAAPRRSARFSYNLYNKGLIYKGHRIINWCPHCATALSDAEVEYADQAGQSLAYPLSARGRLGRVVVVATTRPETMLGDTGVAVNPNDERYKHLDRQDAAFCRS